MLWEYVDEAPLTCSAAPGWHAATPPIHIYLHMYILHTAARRCKIAPALLIEERVDKGYRMFRSGRVLTGIAEACQKGFILIRATSAAMPDNGARGEKATMSCFLRPGVPRICSSTYGKYEGG